MKKTQSTKEVKKEKELEERSKMALFVDENGKDILSDYPRNTGYEK